MNVSIELHTGKRYKSSRIAIMAAQAISRWEEQTAFNYPYIQTAIVITDDIDFARSKRETADVIVLLSGAAETVPQGITVCSPIMLEAQLFDRLMRIERELKEA